jgi:thiol:disulfide interchange protein DsbC
MKRFILCFLFIMSIGINAKAMQMDGCGATECIKCHTLTVEEATKLFAGTVDKVTNVQMSPVRGLWQVDWEHKQKKGKVFIDFSKKYVISGTVYPIPGAVKAEQRKINFQDIPLSSSLILGNPSAGPSAIKVVIYDDPECQHCGKLHHEVKKILQKRSDITFYVKLFPIVELHPKSYAKAKAIMCAKSVPLLERAFAGETIPDPDCKNSELDDDIKAAKSDKIGIISTPTIILQDGTVIRGFRDADALLELIDKSAEKK